MNKPPRWWHIAKLIASFIVAAAIVTGVSTIASNPAFPRFTEALLNFAKMLCPLGVVVGAVIFMVIPWRVWSEADETASADTGAGVVGEREGEGQS